MQFGLNLGLVPRAGQSFRDTLRERDELMEIADDGSTDGTQAVVDRPEFSEVIKVKFSQNQGYGAAIKAGWRATDADLLGFIDADGTCDPDYSVPMIRCLTRTGADVVLAGRLSPESKMPRIR